MTAELPELADRLTTRRYGRAHEHHEQVGSTNDRASAWLRDGGPHGLLVTADAQTAGRGRNGRAWASPTGSNLYLSLGARVPRPRADVTAVGLAAAVAVRRGLADVAGLSLKWPNDLLVAGRKLAGILCESRWSDGGVELVVGIGINLQTPLDPRLEGVATSLTAEGVGTPRLDVLANVLAELESVLESFWAEGFGPLRREYTAHNGQLGGRVRVVQPKDAFEGVAESVTVEGALRVRTDDDALRVVQAADVHSVRPRR